METGKRVSVLNDRAESKGRGKGPAKERDESWHRVTGLLCLLRVL